MTPSIVVVGAGGHGRETISLLRDIQIIDPARWNLLGILADSEPDHELLAALGTSWLGEAALLGHLDAAFSAAVGNGADRRRLQALGVAAGRVPATLVHPTAAVGSDVSIGEGSYVGAHSVLTTHVRLGAGVQVNVGCIISHDVVLEEFATLAPGVHLAGGVFVGEGATVFTGANLVPGVRVGAGAVIGAGAVVVRDVSPGETVVGVPAKPLRRA